MKIGVCAWSLQPDSAEELAEAVRSAGLAHVQIGLGVFRKSGWKLVDTQSVLAAHGVTILSGMMSTRGEDYTSLASIKRTGGVRVAKHWSANLAAARRDARAARELGLRLVSLHAGFLPESRSDPERGSLLARLAELADCFAEQGIDLALETGQEQACTLAEALVELNHPHVGVNFDPANMLLYGMGDPHAALELLAPHVRQIHIKDARSSAVPGEWGSEVAVGTGAVNWAAFFEIFKRKQLSCDLLIEREAGEQRVADVRSAAQLLTELGVTSD